MMVHGIANFTFNENISEIRRAATYSSVCY